MNKSQLNREKLMPSNLNTTKKELLSKKLILLMKRRRLMMLNSTDKQMRLFKS